MFANHHLFKKHYTSKTRFISKFISQFYLNFPLKINLFIHSFIHSTNSGLTLSQKLLYELEIQYESHLLSRRVWSVGNNAINEVKILSTTTCDNFCQEKRQMLMCVPQKKFEFLTFVLMHNYFKISCIFCLVVFLSSSSRCPWDCQKNNWLWG